MNDLCSSQGPPNRALMNLFFLLGYTVATATPFPQPPRERRSTMLRSLRSLLLFSVFLGAVSLGAQPSQSVPTATEILARHEAAIGGKDVIGRVKSISMLTTTHMANNDLPGTVVLLDGIAYRTELNFNGAKMVQCYTATGGWMVNPMAGIIAPAPMPDDQYQAGRSQIYVGGDLHDYAAPGNKLELLDHNFGTYTVKLTTGGNIESTFVIDASTYLIKSVTRRGRIQDQDVNIVTTLSDYRKTGIGLVIPYAITVDLGGQLSLNITVDQVEVNKPVDPAICDLPKTTPPPAAAAPALN